MEKTKPTQNELRDFVNREIKENQTCLVNELLQNGNDLFSYDDIVNFYETEKEAKENEHDEPEPQEIFEWWLCSDWLTGQLEAQNEPILETDFGDWWGRTCTGQAIYLDYVIETIYKELKK